MQHQSGHRHFQRDAVRLGGSVPKILAPGRVVFRLLCHVNTAGGVIGTSGAIVQRLEIETGATIRVEDTIPNCHERVINVIGEAAIDRKISVDDREGGSEKVSQAQEGLIRVFERVLEVEDNGTAGVIGCRLLAGPGQIGAVLGRGGKVAERIRVNTGAKIRILKRDQLPNCAAPDEDLIQLMGGAVAVKKALIAVSRCLQDRTPVDPSYDGLFDSGRMLNLDDGSGRREVVFRFLCSTSTVGVVIGKGGATIKSLEKETGASIKIAAGAADSMDRVVIISAVENPEPLYSPAQIAVIRVFAKSTEVGINRGLILGKGRTTARLIVASSEVCLLVDKGGKVASDISTVTNVEMRLFGGDHLPDCVAENDRVLQIVGEFENVKNSLFQLTGRLRDNLFSSIASDRTGDVQNSYSTIAGISPYGRGRTSSPPLNDVSDVCFSDQMDRLQISHNFGGPRTQNLWPSRTIDNGNRNTQEDGEGTSKTFDGVLPVHESMDPTILEIRTVEIVVCEQAFSSIYGENGSNLARLKEISGTAMTVEDPIPGKSEGKVIVKGTPDQIQIAKGLLQAFIQIVP